MPWILLIDSSFRMQRPYKGEQSFFDFAKNVTKSIIRKLFLHRPNEPVCLYAPNADDSEIPSFTASVELLETSIDSLKPSGKTSINNQQTIEKIRQDVVLYLKSFFKCHHSRLIIITDGGSSDYSSCEMDESGDSIEKVEELSGILISLSDDKISRQISQLITGFRDTKILSLASVLNEEKTSSHHTDFADLLSTSLLEIQKCESENAVFIACGHLFSLAALTPLPCFRHRTDLNTRELQLFLEVFGFLNSKDISHPPVWSNHSIVSLSEQSDTSPVTPDLLAMLLLSLTSTLTVAMVNVYLQQPVSYPCVLKLAEDSTLPPIYPDSRKFVTHGFIHRFSTKRDSLILSLFEEDCLGLPWLGQFAHLAPVADFSGSLLYNDTENITPFPVREAQKLSYNPPAINDTEFQYLNWIHSPQGPTNDINKIVRLCKRLPEKSGFFFKELRRVKSAALTYGWPDLITGLHELLTCYLRESSGKGDEYMKMIDEICCLDNSK